MNRNKFKKIYPEVSYARYVVNHIFHTIKRYTWDAVKSTYLCIRFPFLYPRNRFSGRHYTNWKLSEKYTEIYRKWSLWSKDNIDRYISRFGKECVFLDDKFVKAEYVMRLASFKDRFLYGFYMFIERFIGVFHIIPVYTELNGMPSGWRKRFGIQFCKELKRAIKSSPDKHYMTNFRIMDIKEKYGTLQVYVNYSSPEVSRVINKYEYISQYVCVSCGEDAVKKTLGWICPYCDKCAPEREMWIYIDPVYGWSSPERTKYNESVLKDLK